MCVPTPPQAPTEHCSIVAAGISDIPIDKHGMRRMKVSNIGGRFTDPTSKVKINK
jgi:hypothetical protein